MVPKRNEAGRPCRSIRHNRARPFGIASAASRISAKPFGSLDFNSANRSRPWQAGGAAGCAWMSDGVTSKRKTQAAMQAALNERRMAHLFEFLCSGKLYHEAHLVLHISGSARNLA